MRSRVIAGCVAGALLLAARPVPAAAVGTIPAESGFELEFGARSAIVGDVNGDGVRELVRILRWQNDPGRLAVEVTQVDASGRLTRGGQVLLRRAASSEDLSAGGPPPDADGMFVVGAAEPARLLAWRVDGVERVIVAGIGTERLPRPSGPTLWEVDIGPSGATELRFMIDTQASGSSIHAVDLDGDGTDELVIGEPPDATAPNEVQVRVLRWDGHDFSKASLFLTSAPGSELIPLGDSDGRPGEELGMIAVPDEASLPAQLHRISMDGDGAPRTEVGELPFPGELAAMGGSDGGRLVLDFGEGIRLLRWPAGGQITVEASSPRRGAPLGILGTLGTGGDARLLLLEAGMVRVLDERLEHLRSLDRSPAAALFRGSSLTPYDGRFPGGLADGTPAVVFRGRLVTVASGVEGGGGDPLSDRLVAALPGVSPIGAFGPAGAWTALAADRAFDAERTGGRLTAEAPIDPVPITVNPTAEVLRPEDESGTLDPVVHGAVLDPQPATRSLLLASGPFDIAFAGPPGSSLTLENGNPAEIVRTRMAEGGFARLTVKAPTSRGDGDVRFSARLLVVTPGGHGYVARWEIQILREPPTIVATTPVAPLSFSVPVRGQTRPGASLLVDGVRVAVLADGSFETEVSAGPIPRDVRIEVRDPVGNTSQRTLSVVGFVDFRRLPWIPVVAVLTILAGAVLYLRAPRPARPTARGAGDDATLEEIE